MQNRRQLIVGVGVLVTVAAAGYTAAQPAATPGGAPVLAEVRDSGGQVILQGQFVPEEDDDDQEWRARLQPAGADPDAAGGVEVEVSGSGTDVELSMANVQGDAAYTLWIDGRDIATVRVGSGGRVHFELDDGDDDD